MGCLVILPALANLSQLEPDRQEAWSALLAYAAEEKAEWIAGPASQDYGLLSFLQGSIFLNWSAAHTHPHLRAQTHLLKVL